MLKQILIAVDGSPSSRKAARFGLALAEAMHARATLLTVVPPPEVLPFGPLSAYWVKQPAPTATDFERVKPMQLEVANEWPGAQVECAFEFGPVADTICDFARRLEADLIVVGDRGHGVSRKVVLGSVSQRVIQHAHCPVTVWR